MILQYWILSLAVLIASANDIPAEQDAQTVPSLSPEESSEVAQAIVSAGLDGFVILQISHSDIDIDSCRIIRTMIYQVELRATGDIYEITSEQNSTKPQNCWNKSKFVNIVARGNITRVLQLKKLNGGGESQQVEVPVDQFLKDRSGITQEHFWLVGTKYSYRFGEGDDLDNDIELIEFHIRMMDSNEEFLVSTEAAVGFHGAYPVEPKKTPYPPKVLLSLLGGGSIAKMKRLN
ncbi:hypothetical protein quinque_001378 [Culex quinquefasciatus]